MNNPYTIKINGFYGEVEITCSPSSMVNFKEMRTHMVDEAIRAYQALKSERVKVKK